VSRFDIWEIFQVSKVPSSFIWTKSKGRRCCNRLWNRTEATEMEHWVFKPKIS